MISSPPSLLCNFLTFRPASSPPPSPRLHAPPLSASFSAAVTSPEPLATSLYDVLGLPAGASPPEIKAAYRRLARAVHPDASPGAASAEEFIRVHAAYSTLSDPAKRADYDRQLLQSGRRAAPPHAAGRHAPFRRSPSFPGYHRRSRRTWETDQCW